MKNPKGKINYQQRKYMRRRRYQLYDFSLILLTAGTLGFMYHMYRQRASPYILDPDNVEDSPNYNITNFVADRMFRRGQRWREQHPEDKST
mmetsp:Transcript_39690/g.45193  ORF Transcript_39690/g.45193 Transcript_39690/m.45193 type:complete len:91 (+) Transcript_39690:1183-1455(+)